MKPTKEIKDYIKYAQTLEGVVSEDDVAKIKELARELAKIATDKDALNVAFRQEALKQFPAIFKGSKLEIDAQDDEILGKTSQFVVHPLNDPEALAKALGYKDVGQMLDWSHPAHWTKRTISELVARAKLQGFDLHQVLETLPKLQTARDREMSIEGRDPQTGKIEWGNWLLSAGAGMFAPRTKEAYLEGRDPELRDIAGDVAVTGAQFLPLGPLASMGVRALGSAGKVGSAVSKALGKTPGLVKGAAEAAAVPVAEGVYDLAAYRDGFRGDPRYAGANAVIGTAVNAATPRILGMKVGSLSNLTSGFGERGVGRKTVDRIREAFVDPVKVNDQLWKEAQEVLVAGTPAEGSVSAMLGTKASPEAYKAAQDLREIKTLKDKGFFEDVKEGQKLRQEDFKKAKKEGKIQNEVSEARDWTAATELENFDKGVPEQTWSTSYIRKKLEDQKKVNAEKAKGLEELTGEEVLPEIPSVSDVLENDNVLTNSGLKTISGKNVLAHADDMDWNKFVNTLRGRNPEIDNAVSKLEEMEAKGNWDTPEYRDLHTKTNIMLKDEFDKWSEEFQKHHGYDRTARGYNSEVNKSAADMFKDVNPSFENIGSKESYTTLDPSDWDRALSEQASNPRVREFMMHPDRYTVKDLSRLGLTSGLYNKLGRQDYGEVIPGVTGVKEYLKEEKSKEEAFKSDVQFYLDSPNFRKMIETGKYIPVGDDSDPAVYAAKIITDELLGKKAKAGKKAGF